MRVGVMALQGGYAAHARALRALTHDVVEVRIPKDLDGLGGLVFPGGESTTQLELIGRAELEGPLHAFVQSGRPVLATCAGVILAAREVRGRNQRAFGWLDVAVDRNAWGRQVHSFEARVEDEHRDLPGLSLVFIRAPRLVALGDGVETCVLFEGEPVMVRQDNVIGATFHPELTADVRVHAMAFGTGG